MSYISDCLQSNDIVLSLVSLRTLTGFLEWSAIGEDLLTFLCDVLAFDAPNTGHFHEAKLLTAECLLTCLQRKGLKLEEKKTLLVIFNAHNLKSLLNILT